MSSTDESPAEPLRFADILTTASAAANYLGESRVVAHHLLYGITILRGEMTLEDLGRAISPLVRRTPPGMGSSVDPRVRDLAQRWFADLGSNTEATLTEDGLRSLQDELRLLTVSQTELAGPPV
ncbi:MAG: hypothetical protein ABIP13_08965 [Tepidiformaceae bacterium]